MGGGGGGGGGGGAGGNGDVEDGGDDDEEDAGYKWWEDANKDNTVKWHTLEHQGPLFPPDYVPHGVRMKYDGKLRRHGSSVSKNNNNNRHHRWILCFKKVVLLISNPLQRKWPRFLLVLLAPTTLRTRHLSRMRLRISWLFATLRKL